MAELIDIDYDDEPVRPSEQMSDAEMARRRAIVLEAAGVPREEWLLEEPLQ